MSKEHLEPGDIISDPVLRLGLVMRNEPGECLIAFPGLDELTICYPDELQWIASINDYRK